MKHLLNNPQHFEKEELFLVYLLFERLKTGSITGSKSKTLAYCKFQVTNANHDRRERKVTTKGQ